MSGGHPWPALVLAASGGEVPLVLESRAADENAAVAVWVDRGLVQAWTDDGATRYRARFLLRRWLAPLQPDVAWLKASANHFAVTWIGHATALVQIGALRVLTDPQFSERAFPVQWAGPKRHQPPAIALADLPHIDVVVISHNHYDHLDENSVLALNRQPGGPPLNRGTNIIIEAYHACILSG